MASVAGCGVFGPLPRGLRGEVAGACKAGARALWDLQSSLGHFPSPVVGLLRSGHATTGLALGALFGLPPLWRQAPPAGFDNAVKFLLRSRDGAGALGRPAASVEYPVYATALALRALSHRAGQPQVDLAQTILWLRAQQLTEGWEGHAAFGGFPLGDRTPVPPDAGHVDLSMTAMAIEALTLWGAKPGMVEVDAARAFAVRCRSGDGFVYSPVDLATNKAGCKGSDAASCAPYGSATVDGLRVLLATGPEDAPEVVAAHRVLKAMHRVDRNPGLEGGPMEAFGPAMRLYYLAGAATLFRRLGGPEGWRESLCGSLLEAQGADGTWRGTSGLQKEDCPVVATSLALRALAAASSRE